MSVIGKIFSGITVGSILGVVLGAVMFQVMLFKAGMEEIGVGQIGFSYFIGGFLASLYFVVTGGKIKILTPYAIAVVAVGAIGLGQGDAMSASYSDDMIANLSGSLASLAHFFALLAFWGTPAVVTGVLAFNRWESGA
ncbi:hypothetical protein NPS53_08225 [Pseudomonas putida]|uniref:hypothetical protein n=1 Tax=Pseudomonas putida TaxID=303 RepID=UPI002363DD3C|nr:hypothetical protein [Pseudomonas putida]MDD2139557.1 hypothetical protein [Pseudomonas putida]HDS1721480.1 hypothetical protein [Pseudomonas putida]